MGMLGVPLGVDVGVAVAVAVAVGVGVGLPAQDGNLNDPMRVLHGAVPVEGIYWFVIQKVQSSTGSTDIIV